MPSAARAASTASANRAQELVETVAGDGRDEQAVEAVGVDRPRRRPCCRRRRAAGRAARAGSGAARRAERVPARPATGRRPARGRTRITSTRARSMWRRNWWPRPLPSAAPSINPGMSASDELVVVEPHHAEVRFERGERVVGDLGLGRAHRRDQRRLARVREPDERGVGEQLQFELQPLLLAVLALLGEARRAARVREEARVAAPALAAARREPAVAVMRRGRRAAHRPSSARSCPRARRRRDRRRTCRAASCPSRAYPTSPCGAGGRGTRATTRRCGWPAATRRRPGRRRRRRDRPWARGLRAGTTHSPRRRRHPSRSVAPHRRTRTSRSDQRYGADASTDPPVQDTDRTISACVEWSS